MLGQHRHQPEDQRQFAIAAVFGGMSEIEAHSQGIEDLGFGDLGIIGAIIGPAVVAQQLPGEDNVIRGDLGAVGKTRRGIERERHVAARIVGLHRARQQAVKRERLVIVARQQALDDIASDRLYRQTQDNERVETVECAEHAFGDGPALRRIRIDVVELLEVGRVLEVAEQGEPVPPLWRGLGGGGADECRQAEPAEQRSGECEGAALEDDTTGGRQGISPQSIALLGPGPMRADWGPMMPYVFNGLCRFCDGLRRDAAASACSGEACLRA
jgi:hypothetical protein